MDFNTKNPSTAYFSGLKSIISIIVIFAHSWYFRVFLPFKSGENLQRFQTIIYSFPTMCAFLSMEILFIIGGILAAKGLKKGFETGYKFLIF